MTTLPPDPENMNNRRAASAAIALLSFQEETGTDEEHALQDLLCSLMHWSDRHGGHFANAMRLARLHYEAETKPGTVVTFVRTSVFPVEVPKTPRWMQNIHEFDRLEIQPHAIMRGSSCGDYLEPCAPKDAEVWTVNGRYHSGGIEPCQDFTTEAEARAFLDRVIGDFPHLARRAE